MAAVDTLRSVDTIGEISLQEASTVTSASSRSAFEQKLCRQLLSLGEVAETLADRVMALEARLSALEDSQVAEASVSLMDESTGELLTASEARVQILRERLRPAAVMELKVNDCSEQNKRVENSLDPDEGPDGSAGVDTEYVDDPQIGFLSA